MEVWSNSKKYLPFFVVGAIGTFVLFSKISVYRCDSYTNNEKEIKFVNPGTKKDLIASWKQQESQCKPSRHIVFVKTHKTGSTTIKRILDGYIKRNKLKEATPIGVFVGGYPNRLKSDYVYYKRKNGKVKPFGENKNDRPDIIHNHFRFNRPELEKVMANDTKYFTIIRDPVFQIESAFYFYYKRDTRPIKFQTCAYSPYVEVFGNEVFHTFEDFLNLPDSYLNNSLPFSFRVKNFQSFDLGLDPYNENEEYMKKMAVNLDQELDLVMITDYFYESMILLKDALCLDWYTVTFNLANKGNYVRSEISENQKAIMKRRNKLDFYLYDYFNRTLWKKVDKYGRARMAYDIEKLKEYQRFKALEKVTENTKNAKKKSKNNNTPEKLVMKIRKPYYWPRHYTSKKSGVKDMEQRITLALSDHAIKTYKDKRNYPDNFTSLASYVLEGNVTFCKVYNSD